MVKVSVVVPVYKVKEDYLCACMDSILNQTLKDIEVIVVDDGAPGSLSLLCNKYGAKDTRIMVIHCENGGVSKARNIGMEHATGEYVLFVDADDLILSNTCEVVYEYANRQNSEIVVFGYEKLSGNKKLLYYLNENKQSYSDYDRKEMQLRILRYTEKFVDFNLCTPWCKLYKLDFLRKHDIHFIPGLKRGEDMMFNLYALENVQRIASLNFIGYSYRINEASVSQAYTEQIVRLSLEILEFINAFNVKYAKDERFTEAYYAYSLEALYEQMYLYFFHPDNDKSYSEKRKEFMGIVNSEPFCKASYGVKVGRLPFKLRVLAIAQRLHLISLFCCIYVWNRKRIEWKIERWKLFDKYFSK